MMLRLALAVVLACSAMASDAQSGRRDGGGQRQQMSRERPMSQEDRQRMRDDMRDAYRRDDRMQRSRPQQMSPEERGQLRRDIEDANRELKR